MYLIQIFQKGSPLIEEVSREIARIRLDGTLGSLENKWFKNQLSLPSRNSTMPKDLKLDSFGGLFIINASASTLTLLISSLWLLFLNFMERFDLAIVDPPYFSGPEKRKFYGRKVSPIGVSRLYGETSEWQIPNGDYFDELFRKP